MPSRPRLVDQVVSSVTRAGHGFADLNASVGPAQIMAIQKQKVERDKVDVR